MNDKVILSIEDNEIVNYYNEDLVIELGDEFVFLNYPDIASGLEYVTSTFDDNSYPGLWLVDLNLSDGIGFRFIDQAIELLGDKPIPKIFILTTSMHLSDKEEFNKREYITGYIEKPLTLKQLKECLALDLIMSNN